MNRDVCISVELLLRAMASRIRRRPAARQGWVLRLAGRSDLPSFRVGGHGVWQRETGARAGTRRPAGGRGSGPKSERPADGGRSTGPYRGGVPGRALHPLDPAGACARGVQVRAGRRHSRSRLQAAGQGLAQHTGVSYAVHEPVGADPGRRDSVGLRTAGSRSRRRRCARTSCAAAVAVVPAAGAEGRRIEGVELLHPAPPGWGLVWSHGALTRLPPFSPPTSRLTLGGPAGLTDGSPMQDGGSAAGLVGLRQ